MAIYLLRSLCALALVLAAVDPIAHLLVALVGALHG